MQAEEKANDGIACYAAMRRMATARAVTHRDFEILLALCYCPMTLEQLRKISETFRHPFPTYRRIHERMKSLANANWVRQHVYAGTAGGRLTYYTLSPLTRRGELRIEN